MKKLIFLSLILSLCCCGQSEQEKLQKAAEQGHASAQNNLGLMYKNGQGVQRNYVQAYRWFSAAAVQGYSNASEILDRLEEKMTPEQIARAQKFN